MNDGFYRAFEEKYRGSRELIKSRQRVYLPFIKPLLSVYENGSALDLGCGRGEWLEILKEVGFDGHGVDLDDGMLAACRERGLSVATADAVQTLKLLPSESQAIVSGFHIAEHIPFQDLQVLVQEALRVLRPAGLLILETPNPENIVVGTTSFYLDPTHHQPIPPQLLSFLPEFYGFARTKILRLQEPLSISDGRTLTIKDLLAGVSPDYAIVSQKRAAQSVLACASEAFELEYGVSFDTLADKFVQQTEARALQDRDALRAAEGRAQQAENHALHIQGALQAAVSKAQQAEISALQTYNALQAAEARAQRAESSALQTNSALQAAEARAQRAESSALQTHNALQAAEARAQQAESSALRIRNALQAAEVRARQAESSASDTRDALRVADARFQQAQAKALEASDAYACALVNIAAFRSSTSWRLTRPFRIVSYFMRGHAGLALMEAGVPRHRVQRAAAVLKRRAASQVSADLARFPPNARRVYAELKAERASFRRRKLLFEETARRAAVAREQPFGNAELPKRSKSARPKLAFVSPLPPERTGIADYSAELLPELASYYDIEIVSAQRHVANPFMEFNSPLRDVQWLRANSHQMDRILYHFGNSQFHQHMLSLLEEIPGTVVLHDFFLGHMLAYLEEGNIVQHAWVQALYHAHGYSAVRERCHASNINDVMIKYPANLRVLQNANGVIVHSEYSRSLASQWYGDDFAKDWKVIPLLRVSAAKLDRNKSREHLGLKRDDFVVCSFGMPTPTKLNHRLLDVWLQSRLAQDAHCMLKFVGEDPGGEYAAGLRRTIHASGLDKRIDITGWTDSMTYRNYLAAADVCVQLRSLSRGETSAAVLDCLNYGLPTIVNANGSMAELPAGAVWILPDAFEDGQLADALEGLWQDQEMRAAMGKRAAEVVSTSHAPKACAELYTQAIEQFHARSLRDHQSLDKLHASLDVHRATDSERSVFALAVARTLPMRQPVKKLLLDISATCRYDLKTGIERVTRALVMAMLESPPVGYRVEPVYLTDEGGHWHYRYATAYTLGLLACPRDLLVDEIVVPHDGDKLLGLDLAPEMLTEAQAAGLLVEFRNTGVEIRFTVYDLLPVQLPQFFPPGAEQRHRRWLKAVSEFDGAICISRTIANQLSSYLIDKDIPHERPFRVDWFHLGADVENSVPTQGMTKSAQQTLAQLRARPCFLMVGTIEPRKGYLQALAAFGRLWREGYDLGFAIVGNEGWKDLPSDMRRTIPETVNSLRHHPEFGKRLFWFDGVSDEYLCNIYAVSTCMIAASAGEGFGLPLIEAARHGIPIIARDIEVFREVAADHAYYFIGDDSADLASAITAWLKMYEADIHPKSGEIRWLTWKQSAERLLQIALGNGVLSSVIA